MFNITQEDLDRISEKTNESDRQKATYWPNWTAEQVIQRFINSWNKDAYAPPHKHTQPDFTEINCWISGIMGIVEFDDEGNILDLVALDGKTKFVNDVDTSKWHTLVCLSDNAKILEVKTGPYLGKDDKIFAPWAPLEADKEEGAKYLEKLKKAFKLK